MDIKTDIASLLDRIEEKTPLVHHITNYVTVNDCANIVLAIGASPVMADEMAEVLDMVSLADTLILNIGTLNERTVESMISAGRRANELGIPVVFDPVGAGATRYRTEIARRIMDDVKISILCGNLSEIKVIAGMDGYTKGVDASEDDVIGCENIDRVGELVSCLARELRCVVAVTGAIDVISDGGRTFTVNNGHEMLSTITGTGCMCTSLIGSFCGVTDDYLRGTIAGIVSMGIAGDRAYEAISKENGGSGSFRSKLLDMVFKLSSEDIAQEGKINEL